MKGAEEWSPDIFSITLKPFSNKQLEFTCQRFLNQIWLSWLMIEVIMYTGEKWDIIRFYFTVKTAWEVRPLFPHFIDLFISWWAFPCTCWSLTGNVAGNCSYTFLLGHTWPYLFKFYLSVHLCVFWINK